LVNTFINTVNRCVVAMLSKPTAVDRGKYQLEKVAMHCHLRPPVPTFVIGFNHKAHNAPANQI